MAFKPEKKTDFKRLKGILLGSKIQTENNSLFQTVNGILDNSQSVSDDVANRRSKDVPIPLNDVSGVLAPVNGGSYSLYYFPTLINVLNITALNPFYTQYFRVGKIIYVSGKISITPIIGATLTLVDISLPVVSKFTSSDQLNGLITGEALSGIPTIMASGSVTGNVPTQVAQARFFSLDASEHDIRFVFSYELF